MEVVSGIVLGVYGIAYIYSIVELIEESNEEGLRSR